MRSDPLPTFAYCLIADNVTIGYVLQATFPTLQLFEFEAPLLFDQRLLDSVSNRGYLPFHRWSLITLNTALQEVGRVVWHQARVVRLRFPELNYASARPLRIVVQMAVGSVQEVDSSESTSAGTASSLRRRADPLPFFAVEWVIDGVGSTFAATKIDAFYLGDHALGELALTLTPEAGADLFRNWLRDGNTPRTGALRLLDTSLRVFFTVRCTGLRVRSVTPAISTHAPNPATVRLTYAAIRLEAT